MAFPHMRRKTALAPLDLSAEAEGLLTPADGGPTALDGPRGAEASHYTEPAPEREATPGPVPPEGTVLLSVGRTYFHDGTVGEGRYQDDLAPSFLAALAALHELARAVFSEMGAPSDAELSAHCDRWSLKLGPETGHAQMVRLDDGVPLAPARKERRADQWLRGIAALRQADHAQALAAFETEAAQAMAAGSPQRAAVSYRAAAASARSIGRADQGNRLLRLAGKAYLDIAEAGTTLPQGVFSAYREAARAFLEAGNLPLAQQCLTKALTVGEALGLVERA